MRAVRAHGACGAGPEPRLRHAQPQAEPCRTSAVARRSDRAEHALRILARTYSPDHPRVAAVRNTLGGYFKTLATSHRTGPAQAGTRCRRGGARSGRPGGRFDSRQPRARAATDGRTDAARTELELALEIDQRRYGPNHPRVAVDLSPRPPGGRHQDDVVAARLLLERALEIDEETLGAGRPQVAVRLNNLGACYRVSETSTARGVLRAGAEHFERSFGPRHGSLAIVRNNLGLLLEQAGVSSRPAVQYALAGEIPAAAFGPDDPDTKRPHRLGGTVDRRDGGCRAACRSANRPSGNYVDLLVDGQCAEPTVASTTRTPRLSQLRYQRGQDVLDSRRTRGAARTVGVVPTARRSTTLPVDRPRPSPGSRFPGPISRSDPHGSERSDSAASASSGRGASSHPARGTILSLPPVGLGAQSAYQCPATHRVEQLE